MITATDELGNPIFPRSVTPVTTDSFLFTNARFPLLRAPEAALRVLALGEDPPMFTVAPIDLRNLVLEPGSGTVLGTGSVNNDSGVVRCHFPSQPGCQVVHSLAGRGGFDLSRFGDDSLLVVARDEIGTDTVYVLTAEGEEIRLYDRAAVPGFMARTAVRLGETAYVGGFTLPDTEGLVIAIPLDGGPVREEITFDATSFPAR